MGFHSSKKESGNGCTYVAGALFAIQHDMYNVTLALQANGVYGSLMPTE